MLFAPAMLIAVPLVAPGGQTLPVTPAIAATGLEQQLGAYAAAWGSRDPARIAALHSHDTVFDLRIAGETPAIGQKAAQARFAAILRDNPGYASMVHKIGFGTDFVVVEYAIAMDPPEPFKLGRFRYTPTGIAYRVAAIDMIRFRAGLVSEKVTFLDTDAIRANSRAMVAVGASR